MLQDFSLKSKVLSLMLQDFSLKYQVLSLECVFLILDTLDLILWTFYNGISN
jgi:hypothetical protein